jgi:hypothetical protein
MREAMVGAQVARCRHACMPLHEPPRELTPAERQQLHLLHQKRQNEILTKHCTAVLRHVMSHKVCMPPLQQLLLLTPMAKPSQPSYVIAPCHAVPWCFKSLPDCYTPVLWSALHEHEVPPSAKETAVSMQLSCV